MTSQTLIMVSPEELKNLIAEAVRESVSPQEQEQPRQLDLMTRQEVADMFKITLPTLRNWTMREVLQSYKIGGRRYYRREEVKRVVHEKFK